MPRVLFVGRARSTSAAMTLALPFKKKPPLVAVVRLSGAIGLAGRGALNDTTLAPMLERAFRKGKPAAN